MSDKHTNKKAVIVRDVVKELRNMPFIKSLTLVGSHADLEKPMETVNDLDFIVVVDRLTWDRYKKVGDAFRKVKADHETEDVGIHHEERIGPIKMPVTRRINIILHQVLFDVESYVGRTERLPLSSYDWQRFQPLLGCHLKEIAEAKGITAHDIMKTRGGIEDYINQIHEGSTSCLVYDRNSIEPKLEKRMIKVRGNQEVELLHNAMKNNIRNFMKLHLKDNFELTPEIIEKFFELFGNGKHRELYHEVSSLKAALRNGKHAEADMGALKKRTVRFLEELEKTVSNQYCLAT
jgi:hypothetical protein